MEKKAPFHADEILNRNRKGPRSLVMAFTLVELLMVIAILGLLMAAAVSLSRNVITASQLTSSGNTLLLKLAQAREMAAAENIPVEIRFYLEDSDIGTALRGYQLYYYESSAADARIVESSIDFTGDRIVALPGALSPLLSPQSWQGQPPKPATAEPWKSRNATYISVVIEPSGSTNIPLSLRDSFLTLSPENTHKVGIVPDNYYTVQLDPITGKALAHRP